MRNHLVPIKRMTSHITYAYNEGCSLNIDPHPSFWVLCAYVTIMSFNNTADRVSGGKFVNTSLLCAFVCAEVEKSEAFGCFSRVLAEEVYAFLAWYQNHVEFINKYNQPQTIQSEKEAIWGWSNRNGIGQVAHHCIGTPCEFLSMRFSATVCGLGNIWIDIPLNGVYAIQVREEIRGKDYIS